MSLYMLLIIRIHYSQKHSFKALWIFHSPFSLPIALALCGFYLASNWTITLANAVARARKRIQICSPKKCCGCVRWIWLAQHTHSKHANSFEFYVYNRLLIQLRKRKRLKCEWAMENHLDFIEFTWENRLIDRSILNKWMLRCRWTFVICIRFEFSVAFLPFSSASPSFFRFLCLPLVFLIPTHFISKTLWADWCFCLSKMSALASPSLCVSVCGFCALTGSHEIDIIFSFVCVCLLTIEYKRKKMRVSFCPFSSICETHRDRERERHRHRHNGNKKKYDGIKWMFMCTNTQMPNNKSHFCCSLMRYTQFGGRKMEQWNDGEREIQQSNSTLA